MDRIVFPKGLPGFEEEKEFILKEEAGTPFAQLDSVEHKEVGFILLRPQFFFLDYLQQVDVSQEEIELLEIEEKEQVDVWAVMTLCLENMAKSTVNLRAPLLINAKEMKGLQIILAEEGYSSRQTVFANGPESPEGEAAAGEGAVG